MPILSGRDGLVKWDPTGAGTATATALVSIKQWKAEFKTDKIDVTCFQDTNKVYVPGMRDINGELTGFWNSDDLSLIEATTLTAPGYIELIPHSNDPNATTPHLFSGPAYLDASIDTAVDGAPALSSQILAAGPWTFPASAAFLARREGREREARVPAE
jgi:hypothetical protein